MYNNEVNRRIWRMGLKCKYSLIAGSDIQNIKPEHNIDINLLAPELFF